MGQFGYSNAKVQFDTVENAIKAFDLFFSWSAEQNVREDDYFNISSADTHIDEITYVVSSGKVTNCEWQCEQIRNWFKQQEGCLRIEQDIMTCESSVNWEKGEEDDVNLNDTEEKIKNELGIDKVTIG